jgi:multidrug resistance efflux pump
MVTALHVAQGQTVRKGQVLMELDAAAIQMHLIQARTSLARLETQVQLCKRQNDPKAAKQAQEQYELCKEGVEKLQAGIASASIRAPADGRIEALAIDLGSRPEQDSVLCRVVEPRHFVARGIVPTSQARRIRPEDTGCLLLQDAPDPAHAARVVDIEPVPRDEETQSPDQSRVTLLVIGDDLDLQPGASGVARINGR